MSCFGVEITSAIIQGSAIAFLTSHVVVSGWAEIGDYTFIGVNTTLANNTRVGKECWINAALPTRDIPSKSLVKSDNSEISTLSEAVLFRSLSPLKPRTPGEVKLIEVRCPDLSVIH